MKPSNLTPLDYRPPDQEPNSDRSRGTGLRFFIGLTTGSTASLIYWPAVWNSGGPAFFWGFILAKLVTASVLFCFAGKRAIGAGLLVSFLIGFMIFFGTCAANFKI